MKLYKDYINESLNINPDRYVYPYKKILIIINNEEEYLETISYFESFIGINFFNVANYEEPFILIISVLNLYKLISNNNGSENFWSIFDIFRKRVSDSTFNDFLEYIKSVAPPMYFNMNDVIYKSSDLKLINYLLIDGNKNIFKHLYLNKNKKSYESLSETNLSEYKYPYERILIIVESKEDLLKLLEMFKNLFDININIDHYIANRIITHLVLYVDDFYDIVEKKRNNIEYYELFSVFTNDEITVEQLIKRINKGIDSGERVKNYYNEKDIVYPYEYKKIKNLLTGKASFQSIYKKEIEKSYESLLSKLQGPSEEEVMKNIENRWLADQLAIFINNGYMKGILKIEKMFDDDIYGDGVDGFKSFRQLLEQTHIHISDIINFPNVLEIIDKYGILELYNIESVIKECILNSKKDSLNYLLKKYNFKESLLNNIVYKRK